MKATSKRVVPILPDDPLVRMMDQVLSTGNTKRKKKLNKAVLSLHLRDFLHSTSMHGLKYAADKEASYVEKFLWIALFTAGFGTATFFILRMWIKWQSSPVLISVESTDFPNALLPFPTVSICNVNQASDKVIRHLISSNPIYRNMTRADLLDLMASLMGRTGIPGGEERIKWLENEVNLSNLTSSRLAIFMTRIAQPCTKMLLYCEWQRAPVNCSKIFQQVPSSQGYCCVYNLQTVHLNGSMRAAYDHADHKNSSGGHPVEEEPLKAHGEGVQMGLTVLLDAQIDDYAMTSSSFYGFKVLIHNPEDQPDPSTKGFAVSPGTEVFAGIRTSSIFSTESVRLLPPAIRGCRYSDENDLEYYSRYSQSNCFIERMTRRIVTLCHCLPYYFLVGDASTPTCVSSKTECVQDAAGGFQREEGHACPVNCNARSYTTDVTQGKFPNQDFRTRMAHYVSSAEVYNDTYMLNNMVLLHVFYREKSGIQYRRDTRYDWQDFVSAVGGLLGLGVGFSLMSVMELLYFFGGLRACLRRDRPTRKPTAMPYPSRGRRLPARRLRLYY